MGEEKSIQLVYPTAAEIRQYHVVVVRRAAAVQQPVAPFSSQESGAAIREVEYCQLTSRRRCDAWDFDVDITSRNESQVFQNAEKQLGEEPIGVVAKHNTRRPE